MGGVWATGTRKRRFLTGKAFEMPVNRRETRSQAKPKWDDRPKLVCLRLTADSPHLPGTLSRPVTRTSVLGPPCMRIRTDSSRRRRNLASPQRNVKHFFSIATRGPNPSMQVHCMADWDRASGGCMRVQMLVACLDADGMLIVLYRTELRY